MAMITLPSNARDLAIAVGSGALVGAGVVGVVSAVRNRKRKTTRKKTTRAKPRKSNKKTTKRSKPKSTRTRKTPRTAGKGKDTSTKRIRYTSKGQPYVILKNGRARFIKKSSAKRSHKLKGGRY